MNKVSKIVMASLLVAGMAGCSKPAPAETPEVEETTQTTPAESTSMVGGWEEAADSAITPELVEKFETAFGKDSGIKPVKLIATQLVSGTNYLFECMDIEGNKKVLAFNESLDGTITPLAADAIPEEYLEEAPAADKDAAETPAESKSEEKEADKEADAEKTEAETEEASEKTENN